MKSKLPMTNAILLGGESKRFGSPKAFLPWNGKSLAAHLAQTAGPFVSEVLFAGKTADQVPPDAKALGRFALDEPGFPGPLAGFAAALSQASQPWIFLTGVDMPFWSEETLRGLWNLGESPLLPDAVVPYASNRWQPLCALWNRRVLKPLKESPWGSFQHFLNEGGLKAAKVGEETLRSWDPELLCLRGFNTKTEFDQLLNVGKF